MPKGKANKHRAKRDGKRNQPQKSEDKKTPDSEQSEKCQIGNIKHHIFTVLKFPVTVLYNVIFKLLHVLDICISWVFWIQVQIYRVVCRKAPLYSDNKDLHQTKRHQQLENDIKNERKRNENLVNKLAKLKDKLKEETKEHKNSLQDTKRSYEEDLQEKNDLIQKKDAKVQELDSKANSLSTENNALQTEKSRLVKKTKTLLKENYQLAKEKEDALRRLSQEVSTKLRDNNPNIVDLNDQYRPTKLAEMFSELYDNEWTSAYTLLEEKFTEDQAIILLLNTVMDAYLFCEQRIKERWGVLEKWFLDPTIPDYQEITKRLKDIRKSRVLDNLEEINKDFVDLLASVCSDETVANVLKKEHMRKYVRKCLELCLFMVTTDPPVVLCCPGWVPSVRGTNTKIKDRNTSKSHRIGSKNATNMENNDYQNSATGEEVGGFIMVGGSSETGDENPSKTDVSTRDEKAGGDDDKYTTAERDDTTPKVTNDDVEQSVEKELNGRPCFDKAKFKEYTVRGKYQDFIVWPAMCLHEGGPLLSKGVAQGSKTQYKNEVQSKV